MNIQRQAIRSAGTSHRPAWVKQWFSEDALVAYLFIIPSLFGLIVFVLWPTIKGFSLSFTSASLTKPGTFVGLKNYITLLHDKQFWNSMLITTKYVLFNIPLQTVIALGLAVLISRLTKSTFVRLVIFLPVSYTHLTLPTTPYV